MQDNPTGTKHDVQQHDDNEQRNAVVDMVTKYRVHGVETERSRPKSRVGGSRKNEQSAAQSGGSRSGNRVVSRDHRNRLKCTAAQQPTLLHSHATAAYTITALNSARSVKIWREMNVYVICEELQFC